VKDLTQNVDILPTLVALCGIDIRGKAVDGRALNQHLSGRGGNQQISGGRAFATNMAYAGGPSERREVVIGQQFCLLRFGDDSTMYVDRAADPAYEAAVTPGRVVERDLLETLASRLTGQRQIDYVPLDKPSPIWFRYEFRSMDIIPLSRVTADKAVEGTPACRGKWYVEDGGRGNPHIATVVGVGATVESRLPPLPVGRYQVYAEVYASPDGVYSQFDIKLPDAAGFVTVRTDPKRGPVEAVPVGSFQSSGVSRRLVLRKPSRVHAASIYALVFVPERGTADGRRLSDERAALEGLGYISR
jgi:hypothetical protein